VQYATVIANALADSKESPIVVAHSASGLFLPLIAARRPVSRLVFLAAIIPQVGKSFLEQMRENPDMLWPDWIGKDPNKDHEAAIHFLFHDCPSEIVKWALPTLRLMHARWAIERSFSAGTLAQCSSLVHPLPRRPDGTTGVGAKSSTRATWSSRY
jgi:hypothetical protein